MLFSTCTSNRWHALLIVIGIGKVQDAGAVLCLLQCQLDAKLSGAGSRSTC